MQRMENDKNSEQCGLQKGSRFLGGERQGVKTKPSYEVGLLSQKPRLELVAALGSREISRMHQNESALGV